MSGFNHQHVAVLISCCEFPTHWISQPATEGGLTGPFIATASRDKSIKIWDVSTGTVLHTFVRQHRTAPHHSVSLSRLGTTTGCAGWPSIRAASTCSPSPTTRRSACGSSSQNAAPRPLMHIHTLRRQSVRLSLQTAIYCQQTADTAQPCIRAPRLSCLAASTTS